MDAGHTLFSSSYRESLERFTAAVAAKNGKLITEFSEDPIRLNIAWFGPAKPKRLLLHVAGTHGVEGYLGSAIQLAILSEDIQLPNETAAAFVHCLNAWGMENVRRTNANNVDLNRNFFSASSEYSGCAEGYRTLQSWINPSSPPSRFSLFYPQALFYLLKYGYVYLKQALAGGQYDFPKGLWFGGRELQVEAKLFLEFVSSFSDAVESLVGVEVHSGLGPRAYDTIFSWHTKEQDIANWQIALAHELVSDDPSGGVGFKTRGDVVAAVSSQLAGKVTWLLQEFGTYPPLAILEALRAENRYWRSGGSDTEHWSKRNLLEKFCPSERFWRNMVIQKGLLLWTSALAEIRRASEEK